MKRDADAKMTGQRMTLRRVTQRQPSRQSAVDKEERFHRQASKDQLVSLAKTISAVAGLMCLGTFAVSNAEGSGVLDAASW